MSIKQNINTNALIKCWLFFMACFAIARYPLAICIFLGFIGGLAGGMLSQWWQLMSTPEAPEQDKKTRLPRAVEVLRQQIQSLGSQQQAERSNHYQRQPRVGLFGRIYPQQSVRSRPKRTSKRRTSEAPEEE